MNCQDTRGVFLDAYLDGELDAINARQFERHLAECASCRNALENYRNFHDSVRTHIPCYAVPAGVEQRIRASLRTESSGRVFGWRGWILPAATLAAAALALILFQTMRRQPADVLAQEVVSSHIRSLMANHLTDVLSSDRHTVKPWFNGKIDFAPDVKDLASQGFRLQGGRLDYLNERSTVALIYKRREHTINLFVWPTGDADSKARTMAIKGYNLVTWTRSHMAYWAASDLNANELTEFANDLGN